MKKELIEQLLTNDAIRKRSVDKEKIKSMLESAVATIKVVKMIPLTEQSATLVFRECYESIRQLGDAKWWLSGYEPRNHEVSIEVLKELDIKEKVKLNHLSRFKAIRNDANYRGFKVSVVQAEEIIEFWNLCSADILAILFKELNGL